LISYKILSRFPFEIEECTVGTGAACGAIRLDEEFVRFLKNKLGRHATTILDAKRLAEATKQFDTLKRSFNPCEEDCEPEYEFTFAGAPDIPEIGLEAGYLRLQKLSRIGEETDFREEMKRIFSPVFTQILGLVERQMHAVRLQTNGSLKVLSK
jgi:hypothetical protein